MTQDDLDVLEQHLKRFAPEILEPEGPSLIGRAGEQIANLPSNILESFVRTGQAIGNLGLPSGEQSVPADVPQPYDIPESTGIGQSAVDILLGQLAPELAAALIPYAGVSKLGRAAGLGRLGSEIAGQAAAGGFTGIKHGPEEALKQAVLGGGLGGIAMLPHAQRLLPLAGLAAVDYATQPTPEAGMLASGLDVAFGMLPGSLQALRGRRGIIPNIPQPLGTRVAGPIDTRLAPGEQLGGAMTSFEGPEMLGQPPQLFEGYPANVRRIPEEPLTSFPEYPGPPLEGQPIEEFELPKTPSFPEYPGAPLEGQPIEQTLELRNLFRGQEEPPAGRGIVTAQNVSLSDIYVGPKAIPTHQWPEFGGPELIHPVEQVGAGPRPQNLQTAMEAAQIPTPRYPETGMHQPIEDMPKVPFPNPERPRGKLRGEPEYRRTEGGQIAFPLLGSIGGGVIGGALPTEDEETRMRNIVLGVGLGGGLGRLAEPGAVARAGRLPAINLGQPLRTSFEREAIESPATGKIAKIGTRDIGKSGLIDLKGFKKAANLSDNELKAYQMHYPRAFQGEAVDVERLKVEMGEKPLLKITNLSHSESIASGYDQALANLQHTVDNTPGVELQGEPGEHRLRIHDAADNLLLDVDFEINYDMLSKAGIENPTDFDQLTVAWNNFVNSDWIPDEESARSASVRYEPQHKINPRPIAEQAKKGGFDQIIQIPAEDAVARPDLAGPTDPYNTGIAKAGDVYYQEPHFDYPDDINTLSHTRNYVDEVPGRGKSIISFENQQQWQQSLRKWEKENPPITDPDKLPKGWSWTGDEEQGIVALRDPLGLEKAYGSDKVEAIDDYIESQARDMPMKDHPMVDEGAQLSVKALVDEALKDPSIKGILSTDSGTTLITEGHDELAKKIHRFVPEKGTVIGRYISRPSDPNVTLGQTGEWRSFRKQYLAGTKSFDVERAPDDAVFAGIHGGGSQGGLKIVRVDKPIENIFTTDKRIASELHDMYNGGELLPKEGTLYIRQQKGMEEHYDRRIKNLYEQITGVTAEHVSMGEGSHRIYEPVTPYVITALTEHGKAGSGKWERMELMNVASMEEGQRWIDTAYGTGKVALEKFKPKIEKTPVPGSEALGGKSDISGWWFSLDKLRKTSALKGSEGRLELSGATKFPEHSIRGQVGSDVAATVKEVQKGEGIIKDIPEPEVPRIVSTAVMHEGKPLVGPTPQSSHQQVMGHNPEMLLADVPPDLNKQGGFMVEMPDGTRVFKTREETTKIGHASGQIPLTETGPAHSQIVNWGMKRPGSQGGFVSMHALMTLAGASAGGIEEYKRSGGDPGAALAGAMVGGAAGFMGFKMLEGLTRASPAMRGGVRAAAKESKAAVRELMSKPARDIAGEEVRGRGGVMSKWIRGLEHWVRLNLPEEVKTAWTQARGKGVLAVSAAQQAFKALKQFEPTPEIREAANRFIDGQLLEPADALGLIRTEGGIEPSAWEAMKAENRPKDWGVWKVKVGPEEEAMFHISPDTKAKLMLKEEELLATKLGPENEMYQKFVQTARRSVDELQNIFASGMPEGRLKKVIQNSVGQYMTRTYRIFTDPDYRPTQEQINASMKELAQYKDFEKIPYTDDSLQIEIEQYLHDVKTNKELYGAGMGLSGKTRLDTTLFKEREDLTPTFRELLGEYTDPQERLVQAISRLYPSAQASHFINLAKGIELDGFKAAIPEQEWIQMLASEKDPVRLQRLKEMIEVPKSLKFGALKGMKVNRFVADQLMEIDGPLGMAAHPIIRGVNNWSKIIHTAYDPLRHMRNLVTTPMFLWFGKASMESVDQAVRTLTKKDSALYREMIENGVLTADQVAGEFRGTAQQLFNGHYDSSLTRKVKAFHNGLLELYRWPDLAVRAATYIEAKSRFATQLEKPQNHPDVIRKAVQWTDERTMNYDNIAPGVRLARQLPFFNLYISYTAEIARIMKNITKDAMKGDVSAMMQLGTIAGAFEGAQAISTAMLSPKDRKDWERANAQGPAYSRSRYKFVTSRDAKGNFHYTDFTPLIPTDNFNQMFRSIAKGDFEAVRAVNPVVGFQETPALKLIAEQVTGKDIFTGREFRGTGDRLMSVVQELSPTLTPGVGYEWKKFASIGQENTKTGRQESWGGMIQKYVTGLAPTSVNPTVTQRNATAEAKRHIANERAFLNDTLKMKGTSPESRQRAVKKYQEAVATILETYRNKSNL